MAKQLLSSFGKKGDSSYTTTGVSQGLDQIQVDIEDTAHLSRYFQVVEFDPAFTAGKNCISFNGSSFLQDGSEIKVEVLDNDGNSLYLASPPRGTNYVDIANFTVAIYVYQETVSGAGKVILVGTTTKGEVVRWTGNISINTTYQNVSRVRFYHAPYMEVQPLLYPVIENLTGSTLTQDVTMSGSFYLRVDNANGFYTPGSANYGYTLPFNARIVLWSAQPGNPTVLVDSFTADMIGQPIILHYDYASAVVPGSPPVYRYTHADVTANITSVNSTTEIVVDSIPVGPLAMLSSSGQFTCSFAETDYIQQAVTQPMYAPLVNKTLTNPGFMEVTVSTNTFTSSLVGQQVTLTYGSIYLLGANLPPFNPAVISSRNQHPVTASTFTVRAVTGSQVIHTDPFTYTIYHGSGFSTVATSYTASRVTGSITVLSASNPYQGYVNAAGSASLMKKSYVDIIYRNIDTFTGYVARHKLYAKSNIYPGNFTLIDDTVLGPSELLVDPITVNKNFSTIGTFINQDFINQYWFASSASLNLIYTDKPTLRSMIIHPTTGYSGSDGNSYVIVKAQAIGTANDANYYPYDEAAFDQFSGTGYTSNFIFLQEGTLYRLQASMSINKNLTDTATVMFFFTSSIPSISNETSYNPQFGWKLGEIVVGDKVTSRIFPSPQQLFFTPLNDYYGTLVIVPIGCEVIISAVSLQNYGDYGFSPQSAVVQIPFPVNIANEKWTLKAELFDSNYNLVYTLSPVVQSFDPSGASLYGNSIIGTGTSTGGNSTVNSLTITNNLYLPNIGEALTPHRLLGYNIPTHNPPLSGEGSLGYTDVSDLSLIPTNNNGVVTSKDYINVNTVESGTPFSGRSIAVRYSGSAPNPYGRRVYVDTTGTKYTYS
jgi:hypothetical protein